MSASPQETIIGLAEPSTPALGVHAGGRKSDSGRDALQALLEFSSLHQQVRERKLLDQNGLRPSTHELTKAERFLLDDVLHSVAWRALTITKADGIAIALAEETRDAAKQAITCRAVAGSVTPDPGVRLNPNSGFSGECLASGSVVRCDDSESDPRVDPEATRRLGARSMLAVPLSAKGTVIGLIEAFGSRPNQFKDPHVRSLELLAELVLAAIRPEEEERFAAISRRVVKPVEDLSGTQDSWGADTPFREVPAQEVKLVPAEPKAQVDLAVAEREEPLQEANRVRIVEAAVRRTPATPVIIEANDDLPRPTIWQPIIAVLALAAVAGGVIYSQKRHSTAPVVISDITPAAKPSESTQPDTDTASNPILIPEKTAGASVVTGIRHWSSADSSTVAIDLQDQVQYEAHRLSSPDRIYFDLHETKLAAGVVKNMEVGDPLLVRVRAAQPVEGITRVVLETKGATNFSVSLEQNPYRLVVEVRSANAKPQPHARVELFAPQIEAETTTPTQSPTVAAIAPTPPPHLAPFAPKFRIALDAGHGGWDLGTVGKHGLLEKDLVLDVVQRLGKLVESRLGAQVIYTRADDSYVPLERRTEIANLAHADLFLSIHANYSDYPSARGVETYYTNTYSSLKARMPGDGATSADVRTVRWTDVNILDKVRESRRFATKIQQSLYGGLTKSTPIPNRGVKEAGYVVLTGATMPAVLTEVSFVSSPTDEDNLQRAAYRQQIAESLYKGIAQYTQATHKITVASAAAPKVR